jgi:hypothetical protein
MLESMMSAISKGVLLVLNDAAGFNFQNLAEAQKLWEEIEKFMLERGSDLQYFDAEFLDTVDREELMEAIAQMFIGREWPCFGDSEEVRSKFYEDFNAAAAARGIEIYRF